MYILDSNIQEYLENTPVRDSQLEFEIMQEFWTEAIRSSFNKIRPKRKYQHGIDENITGHTEPGRKWIVIEEVAHLLNLLIAAQIFDYNRTVVRLNEYVSVVQLEILDPEWEMMF